MVDGLLIKKRTMKPLKIALIGVGRRSKERDGEGNLI
jgi:hypothetical protein